MEYIHFVSHKIKNFHQITTFSDLKLKKKNFKKVCGCGKKCSPLCTTSEGNPGTPELLHYRVILVKFINICQILRKIAFLKTIIIILFYYSIIYKIIKLAYFHIKN